jgi:hypothetical protein
MNEKREGKKTEHHFSIAGDILACERERLHKRCEFRQIISKYLRTDHILLKQAGTATFELTHYNIDPHLLVRNIYHTCFLCIGEKGAFGIFFG